MLQAIRQIQQELKGQLPLIGFAGAPFTLASYAIEGGHSNSFAKTKALMFGHPDAWHRLCGMLAELVGDYLVAQIEAGVDAVQVFDSWVGALSAADYAEFALPHSRRIFEIVGARVPTIHFGTGTAQMLDLMREAGGDVIGADWRIPIDAAWDRIGHDRGIQGNLDPTTLLGPVARMCRQVDDIVERVARPARPHLQSRPRHPALDAARARADAGQLRPPRDGARRCLPPEVPRFRRRRRHRRRHRRPGRGLRSDRCRAQRARSRRRPRPAG